MNKRILMIALIVILLTVGVVIIIKNSGNISNITDVTIKDNKAVNDARVEQIEIKDITKTYSSGITTLTAKMYNKTNKVKNVTIKIILKDEEGNELKSMMQIVENLEPDKEKILITGIDGDYTNIENIRFEIVK